MKVEHGGRVTLRLASADAQAVEYHAELATADAAFSVRAIVALPAGAVTIQTSAAQPPDWLVDVVKTTLRGAFRASQTGTPWPRRLSRWRGGPGDAP